MAKLKSKIVYSFHPETKEFMGNSTADESPLEKGKGIYLMPANSTEKEPPKIKEGFFIVWNGASWEYKEIPVVEIPKKVLPTKEQVAAEVRRQRNSLLAQSDWTQLADAPIKNGKAWAEYRIALRNLTKQKGFPEIIEWPQIPA